MKESKRERERESTTWAYKMKCFSHVTGNHREQATSALTFSSSHERLRVEATGCSGYKKRAMDVTLWEAYSWQSCSNGNRDPNRKFTFTFF